MTIGGVGRSVRRISREDRMKYDRMLSERHQDFWGDECPAVDLDFLLCEYNRGISVAIVDYKYHGADLDRTNRRTIQTLSELYGPDSRQLPFFIARYWPDDWSFKLLCINPAAKQAIVRISGGRYSGTVPVPLSEFEYVGFLYRLRKDALNEGDRRYLARLNRIQPPAEPDDGQPHELAAA